MTEAVSLHRACAAVDELAMLPLERVEHRLVTIVRDAAKPDVWDANHACGVRAVTDPEIDEVLDTVDRELPPNVRHRDFRCDPRTAPAFVARLLHEGFEPTATIQMRLDASPARPSSPAVLRLAERESDWESLAAMAEADRLEAAQRERLAPYAQAVARGLTALMRDSMPPARMWIAQIDGQDCGHAGAWGGNRGVGLVEWVYVAPESRRRGVASVLVAHATEDARAHGATTVLIGPLAGEYEAPRRCYQKLGFRPWFVTHRYVRS